MRCNKPLGHVIMKVIYNGVEIGREEVEDAVPAEMIHIEVE